MNDQKSVTITKLNVTASGIMLLAVFACVSKQYVLTYISIMS